MIRASAEVQCQHMTKTVVRDEEHTADMLALLTSNSLHHVSLSTPLS
jgi:hypothetical protein